MVGVHFPSVPQQAGNDIIAEVVFRIRIRFILHQIFFEHIPIENVDSHGGQIGFRLFGFFLELGDFVVFIGNHEAETGGFLPGDFHYGYTEFGTLFLVKTQKITVILLTDLIPGKNDDIFRIVAFDKRDVLIDSIGCALIPVGAGGLLIGRQDMYPSMKAVKVPGLSVSDVFVEYHWLILR